MEKIREPIVEGIFYPSNGDQLALLVGKLLDQVESKPDNALGIISPHAGYRYSGALAAQAFKACAGRKVENVVLLAPIHRDPTEEVILPESAIFKTPLGSIRVNEQAIEDLMACSTNIIKNDIPHLEEHCVEVQLPFVQYLFPQAEIVPVLVGETSPRNCKLLANALQVVFANHMHSTLFVVSANMTSYIKGKSAREESELLMTYIQQGDPDGILTSYADGSVSSCGAGCIATLLAFRNIPFEIKIMGRGCSADVNQDYNELVHYAAIAVFESNKA